MKSSIMNKTVSVAAAIAIVGMIGLSGCGAGGGAEGAASAPISQPQSSPKQARATIVGQVVEDTTGKDRRLQAVDNDQVQVTATNLETGKTRATTADENGNYRFDDVELGDYQIVAKKAGATLGVTKIALRKPMEVKVQPVVLTATGSVKGQINGYGQSVLAVYIPGTSYIAIPDDQGTFELTNVPVGDYTLRFVTGESYNDSYYDYQGSHIDRDIHVSAEGTDLGVVDLHPFDVEYAYIGGDSVNALNRDGIYVYLSQPATKNSIETSIKLLDVEPDGTLRDVNITIEPTGAPLPDNSMNSFRVKPVQPVDAGTYRLIIKDTLQSADGKTLAEPYTKDYTVRKYIDMYTSTVGSGSNIHTVVNLEFPEAVDPADKDMNITITDQDGNILPNLTKEWQGNELMLMGDFEHNKHYTVQMPEDMIEKYGQFRNDQVDFYTQIWINSISSSWNYETPTRQIIQCNIANKSMIDLSSIRAYIKVGDSEKVEIPKEKLSVDDHYYWNDDLTVGFSYKVPYSTNYTVEISAKDIWGDEVSQKREFTTVTPMVNNFMPNKYSSYFQNIWINANVPLQSGGKVVFIDENNETRSTALKEEGSGNLFYNMADFGRVGEFIKPAYTYTVKLEGIRTKDGNRTVDVAPQQITFLPVTIDSTSIQNGDTHVDLNMVDHHVMFQFFGFLTDAQKKAIEGNLTVTSYRDPLKVDENHPEYKVYWNDEDNIEGTVMGVAFTMDPDNYYEIGLKDHTVIPGVVLENKLLTFKTQGQAATKLPEFNVISYGNGFKNNIQIDRNESGTPVGYSLPYHANFRYPIEVIKNEYGYQSCGKAKSLDDIMQNVRLHDNTNDKDLNLTSSNINVSSYVSSYWSNGQYVCYQDGWLNKNVKVTAYDQNISLTLHIDAESDQYRLERMEDTSVGHMPPFGSYEVMHNGDTEETYTVTIHSTTPMNFAELNASLYDDSFFRLDPATDILNVTYDEWYDSYTDEQNNTYVTRVNVTLAKPKYSLVNLTIGGGNGISGLNVFTQAAEPMMTQAESKLIEVHPDLTPLRIESVQPEAMDGELNRAIRINFNRLVKPDDVATFDEDGNLTGVPVSLSPSIDITDVQLQNEWIGNIEGVRSVLYILKDPMDAAQTYQLRLDDNRTIRTLTGTYQINDLNETIKPAMGEIQAPTAIKVQYSLYDNANEDTPMARGDTVSAQYDAKYQVVYPFVLAGGVDANLSGATFTYRDDYGIYNVDQKWIHDSTLITALVNGRDYYSNLSAQVDIPLQAGERTEKLEKSFNWVNARNYDGISSASFNDDGTITLNTSYNPSYYNIGDRNFEVADVNGADVNSSGFYLSSDYYSIELNASIFDLNTTYCTNVYDMYGYGEYDDRFCFTTPESR